MGLSFVKKFSRWALAAAGLAALVVLLGSGSDEPQLPRVLVPREGIAPDAVSVGKVLHLVYGRKGGDIFYVRSEDDGKTLSNPVQINTDGARAVVGHERGPKLAIGRTESIHVVWQGSDNHSVFYARSTDGGKSFSAPHNLAPRNDGLDGASLAADDRGRVYVVWHMEGAGPESPGSTWPQLAYSSDNGTTFAPVRRMLSDYPGGACGCCMMKAAVGPDGELLAAFRGGYHNIRDIYLLRSTTDLPHFESSLVSPDNWKLEVCPMQGPSLQVTPDGKRIAIAWMSQGRVYRSVSADGGRTFARRIEPAAPPHGNRKDALTLANGRGELLFAWVEKGEVYWERVAPDGKLLASGRNAGLPDNSRPSAVVTSSGEFTLIY